MDKVAFCNGEELDCGWDANEARKIGVALNKEREVLSVKIHSFPDTDYWMN